MNSNIKTDNRKFLGCVVATLLAGVLATASAQAGDQPRSETVKFADLNLDTSAGVQALYGRIHRAALRVCNEPGELAITVACMHDAESKAIGKVNSPLLTAFYKQKTTGRNPQTVTASR
jgi:UrcA family protein